MGKTKKHTWSNADIHLLLEHSSIKKSELETLLRQETYAGASLYKKAAVLSLAVLGIGFFVLGVLFFFAYNWESLSKVYKLGIPIVLLIGFVLLAVFTKWELLYKKIILLGASILVGGLFAVFGQVYQTGANAYDLFFSWLLAIAIWTLLSNFPWQWFFYALLANTTLVLYYVQVYDWENAFLFGIYMILLNLAFLVIPLIASKKYEKIAVPNWYAVLLELGIIAILSIGCIVRIFDDFTISEDVNYYSLAFVGMSAVLFLSGYLYGYRKQQLFLIAAIPFALIIILAFLVGNFMNNSFLGYLIIGALAVAGSTLLIIKLSKLQNEWKDGGK